MKYLSRFNSINENVAQAKALLKKIKISESDPDFIKIKDMLKGHDGYVYWFTKLRFEDNQPVDELKNIWDIINDNNGLTNYFTKKVVDLDSVESFWDQYERAKLVSGAKKVLNQFPANQKRFFKLDNEEDFNLLVSLSKSKSLPALIRKISSFRDKATLVASAQRLLTSSFDGKFGELLKLVDSVDADIKVADEENNIIICGVNYEQIRKLGGDTSWCIVRAESTFNSYASGGFQWVIFLVDNFGKNDKMSKIGFTTHFGYTTAHDKYDGYVAKESLAKILSERGVNIADFYISRENLQLMSNWDLVSVEVLLDKKFSKAEIVKKKYLFREKNRYQRQTVSKSDIDFFTDEEITKWELKERIEITWTYVATLDKETILKKGLINRLDTQIYMRNLIDSLKITSDEILEHEIYKSPKVLIQPDDMFNTFSKENIIKYKIYDYIHYGLYLKQMFNKDFTKEEIINLEIYKSPKVLIDAESLSYFNKQELVKYKIIDKATSIPFDIMFASGFSKEEILKKYSSNLDSTTQSVISFFKGKTKIAVKNRLSNTFWRDDRAALGIEDDYVYKIKLIAMTLYDINFDMIGISGLKNIISSDKLPVENSNLEILSSLGFKITDEKSFSAIAGVFEITNNNDLNKIASILKFRKFFSKDNIAHELCTNWLTKSLTNDLYFDYFSFMEHKNDFIGPDYDRIIAALKRAKMSRYAGWDIRTKSSKEGYGDFDINNTIAFIKELRYTKEDIEALGIEKFAHIFEVNRGSSTHADKIMELLEEYGIKLDERDKIKVIRGSMKSIQSHSKGEDGKDKIIYTQDYYKELVKRDFRVRESLEWIFAYFKSNNKLSDYEEKEYRGYFEKGGEEFVKRFEKELKVVKLRELHYKCLSDLKEVFQRPTTYGRSTKMTPEQWYDKYFEMYPDIEGKIHSWDKYQNDIKVIWLLASLDKLDEVDGFYDWDRISNKKDHSGLSSEHNMLHSICKLLCRADYNYDREFKYVEVSDDQLKKLYELVLENVDETQYWVRKYLAVCYYLYDRPKFDKFFNELLTMKNNYEFDKYDRQGDFKEKATKTVRIDGIRFVLKHLAKQGNTEEIESLVNKIIAYRASSTPRANKMTNPEFESTLKAIGYLSGNNREFSNWRDNYIKEIKSKFTVIKESFLLRWSDFRR